MMDFQYVIELFLLGVENFIISFWNRTHFE